MRLTRIYVSDPALVLAQTVFLDAHASHHVQHVLRLKAKDPLIVFDGQGNEFLAEIIRFDKQLTQILIKALSPSLPESPLMIHLGQAISRGEKMDYTLQKAVELGVHAITPLFTAHTGVQLSAERLDSKLAHWRKVIISACEQSGRSFVPHLSLPQLLADWLHPSVEAHQFILHPEGEKHLKTVAFLHTHVRLLVGPEGGFSEEEVRHSQQCHFEVICLGPRILRSETAAPAAIAALQCLWGDIG